MEAREEHGCPTGRVTGTMTPGSVPLHVLDGGDRFCKTGWTTHQ
jgi:hypothetical protein